MTPAYRVALALGTALLVRAVPILAADRMVADVERYHRVAVHVLDVSWNPYRAARLYPYPPVWVWAEAGSEWVARRTGLPFPVLVKLPVLLADLGIVLCLASWPAAGAARRPAGGSDGVPQDGERAAWLYALHPVSLLVTGFHGQFDAVALLFVLLALRAHTQGRQDRSAFCLALAVGLKAFPVLLLPFFLLALPAVARPRFGALATLPVAAVLVPYALDDPGALGRELFGYGGIADFGWIGLQRGLRWLSSGVLARSEARHWASVVGAAKLQLLVACAALLFAQAVGRLRLTLLEASLGVFLVFLVFYGAVSAQYLLWVVPLGVLLPSLYLLAYSAAATLALVGFYAFLAPGVLAPAGSAWPFAGDAAGTLWVIGVAAVCVTTLAWLLALLRQGARRAAES